MKKALILLAGGVGKRFNYANNPIPKQFLKIDNTFACSLFAGGIGLVCTLLYDGVTTLTYPISAGYDWDETVAYALSGLLFTFMHLVSNAIIFSLVVPGYLRRISQ